MLNRTIVILCVVFGLSIQLYGQAERKALQSIEKGKWVKAYYHLTRGRYYDSLKVVPPFAWMAYYSAVANPEFNLDSANAYARQTLRSFQTTTDKDRDKLQRLGIDSAIIVRHIHRLDSSAFLRARQINTTESFELFLKDYPEAVQQPLAVKLRDESAYNSAVRINTYQAFHEFIKKYSKAEELADATLNYERLLFESITSDQSPGSYERFINEYPGTSFQDVAEKKIFEILTSRGTAESFREFVFAYPSNRYSRRAANILFHLLPDDRRVEEFPSIAWSDSLRRAATAYKYLVPYFTGGKVSFMNSTGVTVVETHDSEIREEYLCGNITDDVLLLSDRVIAHNGAVIIRQTASEVDNLGYGLLLVKSATCRFVVHRSGYRIGDSCIDDAITLDGNLVAVRNKEGWGVYAINGRQLLSHEWNEVTLINNVLVLRAHGKYTLVPITSVYDHLPSGKFTRLACADEVESWPNEQIRIRVDTTQIVLNSALDTLYRVSGELLQPLLSGYTVSAPGGQFIVNASNDFSEVFQQIIVRQPNIAVKSNGKWSFFDLQACRKMGSDYDSIVFVGPYTLGFRGDSVLVSFPGGAMVGFKGRVPCDLLIAGDSLTHLAVNRPTSLTLYSSSGAKLFSGNYERLKYLAGNIFMFYRGDRAGLVSSSGKIVLPPGMNAIALSGGSFISLLKDGKFGLYNTADGKQIKPQYNKNLTPYSSRYLVAFKDEKYGFIGWDNKATGKFEFDEIHYWNDSSALVKKGYEWMIYEISTGNVLQGKIRKYRDFDSASGKVAIVQLEHDYGVIHSRTGVMLPFEYSDIINVGSHENPLYFTEKHVEEAAVFIVRYFDSSGQLLRKEVYNQDEYEAVYCPNN